MNPTDTETKSRTTGRKLGETVLEDLSRGDFQRTMHRDLEDVYEFYLDDETRRELDEKGEGTRWLYVAFWVVKSSILKLIPPRRLLLFASVLFFCMGILQDSIAWLTGGFIALMLILLLELKDKLLAQNELATGRAVQFALMPKQHPELAGWETWLFTRPANEVGGDLVDYLTLHPDRLAVTLGDVAGKGLGAALLMAKMQSILRAIAPNYDAPDALGAEMNTVFRRDCLPGCFVSLVYLELEPEDATVRLFNAGHHPPIVVREHELDELPRGGAALGLLPEATYTSQQTRLNPGDLLVIYSDGVTEARDAYGRFFEEERLLRVLPLLRRKSAREAGLRLLAEVDDFVGDARPNDDLSLIVLKYNGPAQTTPGPAMLPGLRTVRLS